jgi:hypothetical protein
MSGRTFNLVSWNYQRNELVVSQHLRNFVERIVRRHIQDARVNVLSVDTGRDKFSELVESAMAPLLPLEEIFTFDVDSAILYKNVQKRCAFFSSESLSAILHGGGSKENYDLSRVVDLQDALLTSQRVIVFKPSHVFDLQTLGGADVRIIRFPALLSPSCLAKRRDTVAFIVHGSGESLLSEAERAISAAYPQLKILSHRGCDSSPPVEICRAQIHVHLGFSDVNATGCRAIDSLSARSTVVQLLVAEHDDPADDVRIANLRTGLVVESPRLMPAAIGRLLSDPAGVVIFQRNADQAVDAFNLGIEQQLWDAMS